jgi:cytochrome c-type biogenesis protein CcmF
VDGMRAWYALASFALAGFATAAIVQEYVLGIGARRRLYHEGLFAAAFRLVGCNRRQYGGYIVHLGVVLLFCAFAGLVFRTDVRAALKIGESITTTDVFGSAWTFTSQGISMYDELNRQVIVVGVAVTGMAVDGPADREQRQRAAAAANPRSTRQRRWVVRVVAAGCTWSAGAVDKDTAAVRIYFNSSVVLDRRPHHGAGRIVMWPWRDGLCHCRTTADDRRRRFRMARSRWRLALLGLGALASSAVAVDR